MTIDTVASAVGTHSLPGSVLTLSCLPGVDYADRFALLAHLIWPPLSAIHRHLVPGVLRKAVKSLDRSIATMREI